MNRWQQMKLGDIARKDRYGMVDGPFGSNLPASLYTDSGIPVVRGVNLSLGQKRFRDNNYVFVSDDTANRLKRSLCQPYDIIFTKKGTLGQTGIIPTDSDYSHFLLSSNQMKLSVNTEITDALYVYYFVSSPYSRQRILIDAMTTGVPKINLAYLRNFPILLPPIKVQKKIAATLSSYDDLIENNKRRITLLEKMSEEIYREWFERMRFPGHKNAKFNKGVPVEWKIKRLGDIIELAYGKALKEADRISGDFPVYGSGGMVGTHDKASVKGPGIIVGRKGNVGSVYWTDKDFYPIDTVYYVKSDLNKYYLYFLLQSLNFINNDAAVPGLNRNQAYANQLLLPKISLVDKFSKTTKNFFDFTCNLNLQNKQLKFSRDQLLSRLISGKLPVDSLDIQHPPSMQNEKDVDHAQLHL